MGLAPSAAHRWGTAVIVRDGVKRGDAHTSVRVKTDGNGSATITPFLLRISRTFSLHDRKPTKKVTAFRLLYRKVYSLFALFFYNICRVQLIDVLGFAWRVTRGS